MIFFYEIPIIFIIFIVLGLLGMDISAIVGILKWIVIIIGVFIAFVSVVASFGETDAKEKVSALIVTMFSIAMIVGAIMLGDFLDSKGSFSLYDILDWIFS